MDHLSRMTTTWVSLTSIISAITLFLLVLLALGSLLNLSSSSHWFIRVWDFPRPQIVVIGWCFVVVLSVVNHFSKSESAIPMWPLILLAVFLTCWHGFRMYPYTAIASTQSVSTSPHEVSAHHDDRSNIRVAISNVELENNHYDKWMRTMREADPDILLVLEPDQNWLDEIREFSQQYPYQVAIPQDNWYGMLMLSRLPIESHQVRYLVQEDVPSIDARIRLKDNSDIRVVAVHPRPPEPIRGNDSTARDAELAIWGLELEKELGPVIIGGDLNDVAWSPTTRSFLRTSGLLDPRRGRGFFNTFHADHLFLRFPLDHIFHSPHFTVSEIHRLQHVGSDHFPMLIELKHNPAEKGEHNLLEKKQSDVAEAIERIERAKEQPNLRGTAVDGK